MEDSFEYQVTKSINISPFLEWINRHFNAEDITQSLLELPENIASQKGIVRKFRDTYQEADLPRKMMELEMIDDIAMVKSPETGKALYSNDKLRDAELKRRKANNPEYLDYQADAKTAERELAAAEDELARLEQRFAAYGKVSEFVAAEMNLMVGLIGLGLMPEIESRPDRQGSKDMSYNQFPFGGRVLKVDDNGEGQPF